MTPRIVKLTLVCASLFLLSSVVSAADSPREVWVKAKCALCHGIDGSSRTDAGRQVHAPDLRTPKVQKRTDEELTTSIVAGHKRMPSFRKGVSVEKARLLVAYIRGLVNGPAPASARPR